MIREIYSKRVKDYQYRILDKDNRQGGDYIYRLLGRRPKREYSSPVKVNISRIDSEEEYPSSVRMNISRIDCWGENRNYIY